jgi:hypothetical protein
MKFPNFLSFCWVTACLRVLLFVHPMMKSYISKSSRNQHWDDEVVEWIACSHHQLQSCKNTPTEVPPPIPNGTLSEQQIKKFQLQLGMIQYCCEVSMQKMEIWRVTRYFCIFLFNDRVKGSALKFWISLLHFSDREDARLNLFVWNEGSISSKKVSDQQSVLVPR